MDINREGIMGMHGNKGVYNRLYANRLTHHIVCRTNSRNAITIGNYL